MKLPFNLELTIVYCRTIGGIESISLLAEPRSREKGPWESEGWRITYRRKFVTWSITIIFRLNFVLTLELYHFDNQCFQGYARIPPQGVLDKLQALDKLYSFGRTLCYSRDPGIIKFLVRLMNRFFSGANEIERTSNCSLAWQLFSHRFEPDLLFASGMPMWTSDGVP